ncbi:MAG: PEP-CTERM sorting domain-containing protein [Myxococcales bacterium]|nr:PEP-CTERM sorting domain-containing protein [Myxococcales bacterium]HIK84660.1 PEP-CTERM sorting domain-containing protein [Myxococcales bacterium]
MGLLPGVAQAEVRNSPTIRLPNNVYEVRPNPTQPIPEPQAALLFALGIGTIASTARRRR